MLRELPLVIAVFRGVERLRLQIGVFDLEVRRLILQDIMLAEDVIGY